MIKNKIIIVCLITTNIFADPWYNLDEYINKYDLDILENCGFAIKDFSYYPLPLTYIYQLDNDKKPSDSVDEIICNNLLNEINTKESFFHKSKSKIEIQHSSNEIFFQDSGKRILSGKTYSIERSQAFKNFAFKLRVNENDNEHEINFDESYIAAKISNTVIYYGRVSKWWSPSEETSLILSNNPRPMKGLTILSYAPIEIKSKIIGFLGSYNYELFINELEKNRHIPKPLMIGQRISFNPNNNLSFSLFRTGFLGGSNENISEDDLLAFFLGSDINGNTKMNHLAGLDFNYKLKNNKISNIYGQIVGEDESNLLPSKHIYLLGMSIKDKALDSTRYIFEFENIDEDGKDRAYQHSFYKSGYKYFGKSIGSSSDGSSKSYNLIYLNKINNFDLKIKSYRKYLNLDNNVNNFYINGPHKVNGIDIKISSDYRSYSYQFLLSIKDSTSIKFGNNIGLSFIITKKF